MCFQTFTFNFFLTGLRTGNWGQGFNSPGMLAFGSFQNQNTQPWGLGTLPIFVFIAACCMACFRSLVVCSPPCRAY